jgi:hypothetical protein
MTGQGRRSHGDSGGSAGAGTVLLRNNLTLRSRSERFRNAFRTRSERGRLMMFSLLRHANTRISAINIARVVLLHELRLKLSVFLVYRMANKLDDRPYLVFFQVLVYQFKTPPVITETLIVL